MLIVDAAGGAAFRALTIARPRLAGARVGFGKRQVFVE